MTVVIFSGGDDPSAGVVDHLPTGAFVIAADSGLDHADRLGVEVNLVIGDMDSVSAELLDTQASTVEVQRHPANKDATDLELAIDAALARSPDQLIVVGGHGGRSDHLFANAQLLCSSRLETVTVRWYAGNDLIHIVRRSVTVSGPPGSTASLVPTPRATAITTRGLRWPLTDATLDEGTTRGVSNEMIGHTATVTIGSGTLLVIQPGILAAF